MSDDEIRYRDEMFLKSEKYGPNPSTDIEMFGDRNIRIRIVTLLSYIRNVLKNNDQKDITISIGKNMQNCEFDFLVNGKLADNLIPKDIIEIC